MVIFFWIKIHITEYSAEKGVLYCSAIKNVPWKWICSILKGPLACPFLLLGLHDLRWDLKLERQQFKKYQIFYFQSGCYREAGHGASRPTSTLLFSRFWNLPVRFVKCMFRAELSAVMSDYFSAQSGLGDNLSDISKST